MLNLSPATIVANAIAAGAVVTTATKRYVGGKKFETAMQFVTLAGYNATQQQVVAFVRANPTATFMYHAATLKVVLAV